MLTPNLICIAADEEEFRYGTVLFHDASKDDVEVGKFLLSAEARKFVKVTLTGEGADEVFLGYGSFFKDAVRDAEHGSPCRNSGQFGTGAGLAATRSIATPRCLARSTRRWPMSRQRRMVATTSSLTAPEPFLPKIGKATEKPPL